MQLLCNRCRRPFNSMFGPPHARCPLCGQTDTRHADSEGVPGLPQAPLQGPPTGDPFRHAVAPPAPLPGRDSAFPEELNTQPWLVAAIVLMVTCCQPGGVVALYFLDRAKTLARHGELEAAREKFGYAKVTLVVAGGLGAVVVLSILAAVLLGN